MLAPLAAAAQVEQSRAVIVGNGTFIGERLHVCADRNDALWDRKVLLDQDKRDVDREGDALARMKSQIDDEMRRLDKTDAAGVAAYNARSAEQNRRVEAHNRRVAEMNGAVALLNADASEMTAYCNRLYVTGR